MVEIQALIAASLNALPGVFSTVQWGGRAYKVGTPKKFKLLSHVCLSKDEDAVDLGFKLERSRAAKIVDEHEWITRHSFRTLASSGWLEARVTTKAQVKVIARLLAESRAMHPVEKETRPARSRKRQADGEIVMRRVSEVVAAKRAEGWRPAQADDFN